METNLKKSIVNIYVDKMKDSMNESLFLDINVNEYSKAEVTLQAIFYSSEGLL